MEPSRELKELYHRCCEAQTQGDTAFFERHFSKKDGVLAIGTDAEEWWTGYADIVRVFKAQLQEVQGFQILADSPLAYRDGSIGWVAGRPMLRLPDGREVPLRLTAVFQEEPDGWKIVQWHFSTGMSNQDLLGERLTT